MPPQNPPQNPPQGYTPIQQPSKADTSQPSAPSNQQQLPAAVAPAEIYGKDGRLTRAGMEHAIKSGGSVIVDGKHINRLHDLPTSASLARSDEEKRVAREQLLAEQARIQAELDGLGAPAAQAQADEQVAAELAKAAEPVKGEPAKTDPAKVAKK